MRTKTVKEAEEAQIAMEKYGKNVSRSGLKHRSVLREKMSKEEHLQREVTNFAANDESAVMIMKVPRLQAEQRGYLLSKAPAANRRRERQRDEERETVPARAPMPAAGRVARVDRWPGGTGRRD